jgi:hypothetical protein
MLAFHRTHRLQILGGRPEIEKLYGDRYRMVVRCVAKNGTKAWYFDNKDQIFADFGSLYSAQMSIDGVDARTGEAYDDMVLVKTEASYMRSGEYVVIFTYETLTDTWTKELEDVVSSTDNGLRLVERSQVAVITATAPYDEDDIGVSTITDGGKTLYLAGFKDETESKSDTQIGRVITQWLEAGVISVSTDEDSITDEVVVNALNLTAAQVRNAVTEVTANHSLKSQSTNDFEGLNSFRYVFEVRSTNTETELGDAQIGVNFYTGIQTDGSSDFIIERQYSISSANVASSIKKLIPPEINDPVFDGTGGTQKAYIVDQEVKPNGKDGAVLTRTFAMLPTHLDEWDEMVIRFPGVNRGPFQLDEGFTFRSQPYSEAVPVRICRDFFLSNPQRICRPDEFRPVDKNGNRVTVLTADTVPTADEYIGYVNSGKYLNDRVSIHRWQGDIWERRIIQFKAE